MRILHTSDWHLGRLFHGIHLTDDQAYVLDQLMSVVEDSRPDVLLIAGDVYDRAVPPPEAVSLLNDVLCRLVLDIEIPVILIAGNHDSPDRLNFGSRIMKVGGLHIFSPFSPDVRPVILEDGSGPVYFYPLPYTEPAVARERLDDETVRDHDSALRAYLGRMKSWHPAGARSVLITHAFVAGGEESESERPLSVGGSGSVAADSFEGFHFTALGHLHRAQEVGGTRIQYSGSLLKYSFSEADHVKSVNLIEMDERGAGGSERISLNPRHDVRKIEGCLEDLLNTPQRGKGRHDYLEVSLLDKEALYEPLSRLRELYPNVLSIDRPNLKKDRITRGIPGDHRKMSDVELFTSFYRQVTGEEINGEQTAAFARIVDAMRRKDREAIS